MKWTLFGCGNMTKAITLGFERAGLDFSYSIYTPGGKSAKAAASLFKRGSVLNGPVEWGENDFSMLGFKPQSLQSFSKVWKDSLPKSRVIISLMAGKTLSILKSELGHENIIRVMPNTPSRVGEGATVLCATDSVTVSDKKIVLEAFNQIGTAVFVEDEALLDHATPINGSGPAYIFELIAIFTDDLEKRGFDRDAAKTLVSQTVLGAAKLCLDSDFDPRELRDQVACEGGTTIEALKILEKGGLASLFHRAVEAAYARGKEIADEA